MENWGCDIEKHRWSLCTWIVNRWSNWILRIHTSHMIRSSQACKLLMWLSSTHLEALTKVNVVISSSLAVHLVDKEAGHRLEQQAEDGHPRAEAKHVPPRLCGEVIYRVIDPKMDDVGQYRHDHPHQKLRGETTAVTLLNFNCTCRRGKVLFTLLKYQNIW